MSRGKHQDFVGELVTWMQAPDTQTVQTNGHARAKAAAATDEMIIQKCRAADNAAKFEALFDRGDVHAYHGGDDSGADFALLGIFKFYTQNPDQLECLMRLSALRRPKWDENRLGQTWLRYSIDNALADVGEVYQWNGDKGDGFFSSELRDRGSEEKKMFPFKTAREVASEAPPKTEWIAWPYVAKGAITEIDGKIKAAGKTTFISHLAACVVQGARFMDAPTRKTRVVWLTEQSPSSFRVVLERAGLLECEVVLVLHWHDVAAHPWAEVAQAAVEKAQEFQADLLIIDTLGQFTGIRGDGENSSGEAHTAMKPLQQAAASGLGVIVSRHERKGGGEVGESGRGSSAFGGAVDVILSLRRLGGNYRATVRCIEALSRFDDTPDKQVVELTPHGYRNFGDATEFGEKEAKRVIVELLPTKPEHAIETANLIDCLAEQGIKRSTANDALAKLVEGNVIMRLGKGKKGDPYRYFKPEDTLDRDPAEAEEFVSSEPLSLSSEETNVSEPDPTYSRVADVFANPPDWLPGLLEKYHQDPERYFGSLCHTVAAAVYKDGSVPGEDVAEEVRAVVGQNVVNVDAGEYCDEHIGRSKRGSGLKKSKWHNPFLMDLPDKKRDGTREEVLQKFDRYLDGPVENYQGEVFDGRHLMADLHEIAGKTLGCHCAPLPCHGDVLARRAGREQGDPWKG